MCTDGAGGPTIYAWYGNADSVYFPCTAGTGFNSSDSSNSYCSACDTADGYGSDYGFGFCVDCTNGGDTAAAVADDGTCSCDDGSTFDYATMTCSGDGSSSASFPAMTAAMVSFVSSLILLFGQ